MKSHLAFFVAWLVLIASGFAYVSMVLCHRSSPLQSGNNFVLDFVCFNVVCSVLYFFGPIKNFPVEKPFSFQNGLSLSLTYLLPFFLALHWIFVGRVLGAQFSLKPSDLSSLNGNGVLAVSLEIVAAVLIFGYHGWQAKRAGSSPIYISLFIAMVALVGMGTIMLRESHYLHVHHYCIGLAVFPFCRFETRFSRICQAFFLGLALEGVARWGFDPLWYVI